MVRHACTTYTGVEPTRTQLEKRHRLSPRREKSQRKLSTHIPTFLCLELNLISAADIGGRSLTGQTTSSFASSRPSPSSSTSPAEPILTAAASEAARRWKLRLLEIRFEEEDEELEARDDSDLDAEGSERRAEEEEADGRVAVEGRIEERDRRETRRVNMIEFF